MTRSNNNVGRGHATHQTQTRFVTDLAAGGVVKAQTTADGRYLVFSSTSPLVTAGPGADTDCTTSPPTPSDCAVDVYRYDAVTATLVRVSTSVSGSGGNTPGLDATINTAATRGEVNVQNSNNRRSVTTMTSDGSTVVFETSEALSVDDVDGGPDVYVWHDDGRVSLISDGVGGGSLPWITPSGRDIFFVTKAKLSALDGDVISDTTLGTVRLALIRDRLVKRGRLSVRLVVSHSKVALDRSVTLRLTHAKLKTRAKRGSVTVEHVGASGGRRS